jgi:HEAT repeat protein
MYLASLAMLLAAQPVLVQQKMIALPAQPVPPAVPGQAAQPAPAVVSGPSDEQVFQNLHLETSGPALLTFFRRRATANVEPKRLDELVKQLSDKTAAVHDRAAAELIGYGPVALPVLRRAVNHADDEDTSSRARKCIESVEGRTGIALVQSAVRLLAANNPQGAAEALLNYLPMADDDSIVQEIETALLNIGRRDSKIESALKGTLTDAVPVRRSIAARVLSQTGGTAGRQAVHSLLKDPSPSVRMQAALGLADTHDAEAVPVLIDLVAYLPPEGRKQVEAYLTELAGDWSVKTPQGNDVTSGRLRRELWSAWWRSLDGQQLLDEFRSRTLSDAERAKVLELIQKLDDVSPDVRARASEDIINIGSRAAPLLRQVVSQANPRLLAPARQCLDAIEGDSAKPLPDAAPRLLALRRPEGTVEALLGYVPFAETDAVLATLTELLAAVGCTDGKADPLLVRALEDKHRTRRAAAAVALCKGRAEDALPAVRQLLKDPDAMVRMRTAVALVERGEKSAVPPLIALLATLPPEQVWEVEDLLTQLAGDKAPPESAGGDDAARKAAVEAWKKWWAKEEKSIDLAKLASAPRDRGLLLAIEMQQGRVLELNRTGQVRWKIEGLQWPWDALVCPNGNVFVIHQSGNWLSMRDRQGKELWQQGCNQAFSCQRLRNGNIFVVCRNQLLEFDANGKQVFNQIHNVGLIVGGHKFRDGQMAFLTQQGQYVRLDATGKQVKSFQVPFHWQNGVQGAEILPGDRVVVSLGIGKVAEYADGGKLVWEANVINPSHPHRLANGHTLVTQVNSSVLLELNRAGKIVSEKKDLECHPFRVHRR